MRSASTVPLLALVILSAGCPLNGTEQNMRELKSANIMVRNRAIYNVGKRKDKTAATLLVKFLRNDQPTETKLCAIKALGNIGEGDSIDALVGVLEEADSDMRVAAVEALGKIKNPRGVPPLVSVLEDDEEEGIKLTAIWALGNIRDKSAIPALTELLHDPDEYVRYNAAQSLKKIGNGK